MIILLSDGISNDVIEHKVFDVIADKRTVAFLTTASVHYKEQDKHIPKLKALFTNHGFTCRCIDIEFSLLHELEAFDVIYMIGGNPFFLLKHIHKQQGHVMFEKFRQTKVLIGASAGALVMQEDLELIARLTPTFLDGINIDSCEGLGLLEYPIVPHYERFKQQIPNFENIISDYERETGKNVRRFNDGEVIVIA